jgi:hypothetical protein
MSLPGANNVYRMVHVTMRDRQNKSIPAIRCFSPSLVDNYKLSVDHAENTSPEISLSRVGATLKKDGTYKNIRDFEIYSLNVRETMSIPGILDIFSDPINNNPEIPGTPNNPSHSLIHISNTMEEDEPEIYAKLRDNASKVNVEYEAAIILSGELKNKWVL